MIKFVEKNNSSLYFVYVPSKRRYINPKVNTSELFNYGKLIELVKSNNINLIDLNIDFFSKEKNPLDFILLTVMEVILMNLDIKNI